MSETRSFQVAAAYLVTIRSPPFPVRLGDETACRKHCVSYTAVREDSSWSHAFCHTAGKAYSHLAQVRMSDALPGMDGVSKLIARMRVAPPRAHGQLPPVSY